MVSCISKSRHGSKFLKAKSRNRKSFGLGGYPEV